jgi:hypothetical protein
LAQVTLQLSVLWIGRQIQIFPIASLHRFDPGQLEITARERK